jgi:hypothetical protein
LICPAARRDPSMTSKMAAAAAAAPSVEDSDLLIELREALSRWRDADAELSDLSHRVEDVRERKRAIERDSLPDLFERAGVSTVAIPARGNLPSAVAKLVDYCRANIVASWPEEVRERGFAVLERIGLGDLIKCVVSVSFNRDDYVEAQRLAHKIKLSGLTPQLAKSVHWSQLSSALREVLDSGAEVSREDLDAIGADVGKTVKVTVDEGGN